MAATTATGTAADGGPKGLAAALLHEHAVGVEQRDDRTSGDYEYDEAHERLAGEHSHPEARRAAPAPAGRPPPERDGDMSYDEAHDF